MDLDFSEWHDAEVLAGATSSAAIWGTRDVVDASALGPPLTLYGVRQAKVGERIGGESLPRGKA